MRFLWLEASAERRRAGAAATVPTPLRREAGLRRAWRGMRHRPTRQPSPHGPVALGPASNLEHCPGLAERSERVISVARERERGATPIQELRAEVRQPGVHQPA